MRTRKPVAQKIVGPGFSYWCGALKRDGKSWLTAIEKCPRSHNHKTEAEALACIAQHADHLEKIGVNIDSLRA